MEGNVVRFFKSELGVLLFIFVFLLSCLCIKQFFVVIPVGHTGVQSRFGKVYDEELSSGFHTKSPFVKVVLFDIQTQVVQVIRDVPSEHMSGGGATKTTTTLLYHLMEEKASDMYRDVGVEYEEVVVRSHVRSGLSKEDMRSGLEAYGIEVGEVFFSFLHH